MRLSESLSRAKRRACLSSNDEDSVALRLIYRPMLSYCIWKAILRAIKGAWVSWGKLERTASVPVRA